MTTTPPTPIMGRPDTAALLRTYSHIRDSETREEIFAREINPLLAAGQFLPFNRVPIEASNTLGTLTAEIAVRRTLSLLSTKRPYLKSLVTDFSDEPINLGDTIITRSVAAGVVKTFGSAPSTAVMTNYPVQLDKFLEVAFEFTVDEVAGTSRNLIEESAQSMQVTLGNYICDAAAALITSAFTAKTTTATASVTFNTLAEITKALNDAGAPTGMRSGWVNSAVALALKQDPIIGLSWDKDSPTAWGRWRNILGFSEIWEYPELPGNGINLTGFFAAQNALIIVVRPPQFPPATTSAKYYGKLTRISEPVSGFSVMYNVYIDAATWKIVCRVVALLGVARGELASGHRLVSS